MEKMPRNLENGVEICKEVFEGLEFIRQSGVTNMLDRPTVLQLAKEWEFEKTADWIENSDRRTYAELIFKGPIVIDNQPNGEFEDQGADLDEY